MKRIKVAALFGVGVLSGFLIGVLVGYDLELGVYSPNELESMIASGDIEVGARIESLPKVKPKLTGRKEEKSGEVEKKRLYYDSDSAVILTLSKDVVTEIIEIGD